MGIQKLNRIVDEVGCCMRGHSAACWLLHTILLPGWSALKWQNHNKYFIWSLLVLPPPATLGRLAAAALHLIYIITMSSIVAAWRKSVDLRMACKSYFHSTAAAASCGANSKLPHHQSASQPASQARPWIYQQSVRRSNSSSKDERGELSKWEIRIAEWGDPDQQHILNIAADEE